jgi:hypothetical protein
MSDVSDSRVRLLKTVFVVYYHADFAQGKQFLLDFGLTVAFEPAGKEIFFQG